MKPNHYDAENKQDTVSYSKESLRWGYKVSCKSVMIGLSRD